MSYSSGIYVSTPNCGKYVNHVVLLTGYKFENKDST